MNKHMVQMVTLDLSQKKEKNVTLISLEIRTFYFYRIQNIS